MNPILKKLTAAVISAISILVAASFVVLHHSEKSIELVGNGVGEVDTSGMQISFLACNPSPVPVVLDGVGAVLGGSTGPYGELDLHASSLGPFSAKPLGGRMEFSDIDTMNSFVGWSLGQLPNPDFTATLKVRERLFGIIPYSYEKNYTMAEFSGILFGNGTWSCKEKGNYGDTRQQLELEWARMSVAGLLYSENGTLGNSTLGGTRP